MARNPKPRRRAWKLLARAWRKIMERDCRHEEIVPLPPEPDGSVFGQCLSCGDSTFPIRDVGYEEFVASGDAPKCGVTPEFLETVR